MFDELPRLCRENVEYKHVYSKCRSDQLKMWNQPSMTSWADSDAESRLFYIDMFQFCCDQANCCAINSSPQSVVLSAPFLLVIVLIVSLLSIAILHCQWHDLNCHTCSVIRHRQTRTLLSPKKKLTGRRPWYTHKVNTQRLMQIIILLLFLAGALAQCGKTHWTNDGKIKLYSNFKSCN